MNRLLFMAGSLVLVSFFALLQAGTAYADIDQTLPSEQIERIKQNCVNAQTTLSRLEQSDTGLRVNLGQQYEFIAGKLMAPMNSRVILNQMEVGGLVDTATTFQHQIEAFRTAYRDYGSALDSVVKADCQKNPQQFYNDIATARTKRQAVREAIENLNQSIRSYGSQIGDFSKKLQQPKRSEAK